VYFAKNSFSERNSLELTDFLEGKEAIRKEIAKELNELKESIDKYAVLQAVEEGSDNEVYINKDNETLILKDKETGEKITLERGKELNIVDKDNGRRLSIDLKNDKVKKNKGFEWEQKTPEVKNISYESGPRKELFQHINVSEDLSSVSMDYPTQNIGKVKDLLKEVAQDDSLSKEERKEALNKIYEATKRSGNEDFQKIAKEAKSALSLIGKKKEETGRNNDVLGQKKIETQKKMEATKEFTSFSGTLAQLNGKIDSASSAELKKLKATLNTLKGSIEKDKNLTVAERSKLLATIEGLSDRIKERETVLERAKAEKAIQGAEKAIDDFDLAALTLKNCGEDKFKKLKTNAQKEFSIADELSEGHPDLESRVLLLGKKLAEKEGQLDMHIRASEQQKKVQDEYTADMDKALEKQEKAIEKEMEIFKKNLEKLEKKPENLKEEPLKLNEGADLGTFSGLQAGMETHRQESMKMHEEMIFLQGCAQEMGTKVVEFENQKSAFTLGNIGRSIGASLGVLPGVVMDIGLLAGEKFGWNPKQKRAVDYVEQWTGIESPRTKMLKEKEAFQTAFEQKQKYIKGKESQLEAYGATLQKNSEDLKNTAADKEQEKIETEILKSLPLEADANVEPWKTVLATLTEQVTESTLKNVERASAELDQVVDGSVENVGEYSESLLVNLHNSNEYIKGLDVKSPSTLDMSVGFLTKNVAKALDVSGDFLAEVPVIGVAGGVLRGLGGFAEGIGTLITDPIQVLKGVVSLVNVVTPNGRANIGEAWKGLASGFLAGEAWGDMVQAFKDGDLSRAFGEMSAWVGEAGLNVATTFFTGGAAAGAKGAGVAGGIGAKTAKFAGKIKGVSSVARKIRYVKGTKLGAGVVKYTGLAADTALMPMRIGLKPLKMFKNAGKIGSKLDDFARVVDDVALRPTNWSTANRIKSLQKSSEKLTSKIKNISDDLAKYGDEMGDIEVYALKYERINLKKALRKNKQTLKKLDAKEVVRNGIKKKNIEVENAKAAKLEKSMTDLEKTLKTVDDNLLNGKAKGLRKKIRKMRKTRLEKALKKLRERKVSVDDASAVTDDVAKATSRLDKMDIENVKILDETEQITKSAQKAASRLDEINIKNVKILDEADDVATVTKQSKYAKNADELKILENTDEVVVANMDEMTDIIKAKQELRLKGQEVTRKLEAQELQLKNLDDSIEWANGKGKRKINNKKNKQRISEKARVEANIEKNKALLKQYESDMAKLQARYKKMTQNPADEIANKIKDLEDTNYMAGEYLKFEGYLDDADRVMYQKMIQENNEAIAKLKGGTAKEVKKMTQKAGSGLDEIDIKNVKILDKADDVATKYIKVSVEGLDDTVKKALEENGTYRIHEGLEVINNSDGISLKTNSGKILGKEDSRWHTYLGKNGSLKQPVRPTAIDKSVTHIDDMSSVVDDAGNAVKNPINWKKRAKIVGATAAPALVRYAAENNKRVMGNNFEDIMKSMPQGENFQLSPLTDFLKNKSPERSTEGATEVIDYNNAAQKEFAGMYLHKLTNLWSKDVHQNDIQSITKDLKAVTAPDAQIVIDGKSATLDDLLSMKLNDGYPKVNAVDSQLLDQDYPQLTKLDLTFE
jgi:hypothetical protein